MKNIETQIIINSTKQEVWKQLTDFGNYHNWNPFIIAIDGNLDVGSILKVTIRVPGSNAMTFKPKVKVNEVNNEFRWKGKLGIKGIFDGEHYFKLKNNGDNTCTFIQGEIFSGLLVNLMPAMLLKTENGFKLMNEAIRNKCENQ